MQNRTLERIIHWCALISVAPAAYLPFYNQFLHGGRDAASIVPRSAEYAEVHIVAGVCAVVVIFGVMSLYLRIADAAGRLGLVAFMIAAAGQAMYAGQLFVDSFFNPMLAKYDPVLQTHFHSAHYFSTPLHILGAAIFFVPFVTLVLIVGYGLFGTAIMLSGVAPRGIGVLLVISGVLLGTALFELQWIETLGYAALAVAMVWSAISFRESFAKRRETLLC